MSQVQRAAVVAEALSWLRTPYHHNARLKGVGTDCGQFPLAVYEAAGVLPHVDTGDYSPTWNLHRAEELYLGFVQRLAHPTTRQALGPGDFVVWRVGRTFSHGAIVIDPPQVIHAVQIEGAVTLGDMDRDVDLISRKALYFTLWPKER
ncbi:MAG: NlpC/P60 family protein [Caulobacteraceae bacterium]|nr:NlpC/P60 family protein [Caulobacteraceae bacterium]